MDVVVGDDPVRHRPVRGARRGGRLLGADRIRRVPGYARRRRAPVGDADPGRPAGRHRRRRARSGAGWPSLLEADGASVVICDVECRRGRVGAWPSTRRWRSAADAAALIATALDVFSPNAMGARWTTTPSSALRAEIVCGGGQQPARPSRARAARPTGSAKRGILYAPGLRRQQRRGDPGGRRAAGVRLRAGPGPDGPDLRHDARPCCGTADGAGRDHLRRRRTGSRRSGSRPRRPAACGCPRGGRWNVSRWGSVVPTKITIPGAAPRRSMTAFRHRHE